MAQQHTWKSWQHTFKLLQWTSKSWQHTWNHDSPRDSHNTCQDCALKALIKVTCWRCTTCDLQCKANPMAKYLIMWSLIRRHPSSITACYYTNLQGIVTGNEAINYSPTHWKDHEIYRMSFQGCITHNLCYTVHWIQATTYIGRGNTVHVHWYRQQHTLLEATPCTGRVFPDQSLMPLNRLCWAVHVMHCHMWCAALLFSKSRRTRTAVAAHRYLSAYTRCRVFKLPRCFLPAQARKWNDLPCIDLESCSVNGFWRCLSSEAPLTVFLYFQYSIYVCRVSSAIL